MHTPPPAPAPAPEGTQPTLDSDSGQPRQAQCPTCKGRGYIHIGGTQVEKCPDCQSLTSGPDLDEKGPR